MEELQKLQTCQLSNSRLKTELEDIDIQKQGIHLNKKDKE